MMFREAGKKCLSVVLGSSAGYRLSKRAFHGGVFPYVQAVTYHGTPACSAQSLRRHLEWYQANFEDCGLDRLRVLLERGEWPYSRPGLIISFDDGLRSNYDIALPLIEEFGFTGWFMIPPGFVNAPESEQRKFALRRLIDIGGESPAARVAMTWDEVIAIQRRGHVIASHTLNHTRLSGDISDDELDAEIRGARSLMESRVGSPVDAFGWVGGEEWAYSRSAFRAIAGAGHSLVFATNCAPIAVGQSAMCLERYHVDADYALRDVRLVLGGFYDVKYSRKRQRIADALGTCR